MTETLLSLTGMDVVNVIKDMSRRRESADKISQVYFRLVSALNGDLDPESREAAEKILAGVTTNERNLSQEVRQWVLSSSGIFLSSDVIKCLQVSSRSDSQNISNILRRLKDEGIIEKSGKKNGCFRKIDRDLEEIDFINVTEEEIHLSLPFDIHKLVKIMPGNVIVIAGEPNAGKTAFLLNVARENQHDHEIHYFSSEMGPLETRERLTKFANYPLSAWTTKFWERSSDFADVVRSSPKRISISTSCSKGESEGEPKRRVVINIIDFLEVHKDFWEVGGLIKSIWEKIGKGIAIIAIQKNPTKTFKDGTTTGDYGIGGARGLEKPRLYLTMSGSHILKVVKAKNWRTDKNPNGLQLNFKLANGCYFTSKDGWYREGITESKHNNPAARQPGDDTDAENFFPKEV